jgi:pilus assembly protein CpaB
MRRPGTIFLIAIVIGALTAAMAYRNLHSQRAEIEAARLAMLNTTVDVVVAAQSIPIGTRITAEQVHAVRWPADIEPEGAAHDPQVVIGRIARTTVDKNQPLLETHLMSEEAGLLPMLISEGMRAMSVKVDDVTGVSGFITPNSRVDVLVSGSDGEDREQRSKLILQNVKVLATGKSIEQRDQKPVEVPTVTLLVSPQDAEKLTLAARQEPVRLALRNYRDDQLVGTTGMTTGALLGRPAPAMPAPVLPPSVAVKSVRPAPRTPYTVEIFLGNKMQRQEFENQPAPRESSRTEADAVPAPRA